MRVDVGTGSFSEVSRDRKQPVRLLCANAFILTESCPLRGPVGQITVGKVPTTLTDAVKRGDSKKPSVPTHALQQTD